MTDSVTYPDHEDCSPSATHAISRDAAATIAVAFKALADPLRLRMLSAIATDPRGESCVCDFATLADVSQPTVSHHLKVLKEPGLLVAERRGTWIWYRIASSRRAAVTALLNIFAPAVAQPCAAEEDASKRAVALATMDAQVEKLAEELADATTGLSRELVVQIVWESYTGLVGSAKLTGQLLELTKRFARQRLTDLARDRGSAAPQVLFLCVENAGRSQLAEALANRLSGGNVVARSAGSTPTANVNPHVRSQLIAIEGSTEAEAAFPKPLTYDAVRAADVVVTMGCSDVCPIVPGVHYEDWTVGDPALASPEGTAAIRGDIESRVRGLLDRLTNK